MISDEMKRALGGLYTNNPDFDWDWEPSREPRFRLEDKLPEVARRVRDAALEDGQPELAQTVATLWVTDRYGSGMPGCVNLCTRNEVKCTTPSRSCGGMSASDTVVIDVSDGEITDIEILGHPEIDDMVALLLPEGGRRPKVRASD